MAHASALPPYLAEAEDAEVLFDDPNGVGHQSAP
tara:strand:+ start:894 stop:995 length:102 start_codon:yes stop_codon:yes gene_type:complete